MPYLWSIFFQLETKKPCKSKSRVGGGTNANKGEEKEDNLQYVNDMSGNTFDKPFLVQPGVNWDAQKIDCDWVGTAFCS